MFKRRIRVLSLALLLLAAGLPVTATDLTLTVGGRVTIELITSEAAFRNTLAVAAPGATIAITGCELEPAIGLLGTHVVSEKVSQRGCRVNLDSDPGTAGIQPFAAGSVFEFSFCAQTDADPECEFVWSSDPAENSDAFDHLMTTPLFAADFPGRIFQLAWEDLEGGGDNDFNDLIAVLRVELDSDGDGLWDDWEQFGIDTDGDGTIDLDLPALGADPMHKDLFLEIDFMDCTVAGSDCAAGDTHNHQPKAAAVAAVVQAFADAPVSNPDGINGIDLHVDVDNAIAHQNALNINGLCFAGGVGIGSFDAVKADASNFGTTNPRRFAYRYGLFTHQQLLTTTSSGCGELPGNDFQVSLGGWNVGQPDLDGDGLADADVGTVQQQAGTLMHEFGHNLNLRHGGDVNTNRKPNYLSIMSYSFQTGGIPPTDPDGGGPLVARVDFSGQDLPDLDEANLDEPAGVGDGTDNTRYFCPGSAVGPASGPIDWNCDLDTTDTGVAMSINGDGVLAVLTGFDDWNNLRFDFQGTGDFEDGDHSSSERVSEPDYRSSTPPQADAGSVPDGDPRTPPGPPFEPYRCALGETIRLDGSGSFDRNGKIVSYLWNYPGGDAVDAIGSRPSFVCLPELGVVTVQLTVTDDDGLTAMDQAVIDVELPIDIRPKRAPNVIRLKKSKHVPVAVLSAESFDATSEIDRASLTFGRTGDEDSLIQLPVIHKPKCFDKDVNRDRVHDLVCVFAVAKTGFQTGDAEGVLKGRTLGGMTVEGRDSVEIRP